MRHWLLGAGLLFGTALGTASVVQAKAPRPTKAEAKANAKTFKAAHRAARRFADQKQYAQAAKSFRAALKIEPANGPVLGELGWVLFKDGRLTESERVTRQAITLSRSPKQRGALYYNLGRLAEEKGVLADTITFYARSLAARPGNATVERRLAAQLAIKSVLPKRPLESLCAEAMNNWGCVDKGEDGMRCTCVVKKTIESKQAATAGVILANGSINNAMPLRAALLQVEGEGMGLLDELALAVETGSGGWQLVGSVATDWTPGVGYVHHNGVVKTFEFQDIVAHPERGGALVIDAIQNEADGDYGDNVISITTRRTLTVCSGASGDTVCAAIPVEVEDIEEAMIEGEPVARDRRKDLGTHGWKLKYTLAPDRVLLTADGQLPKKIRARVGAHALDSLHKMQGAQVTPLN